MFEKVSPSHPDKLADRIAGAIVDLAYKVEENPKIAVEVLLGHRKCHIICETSTNIDEQEIIYAVRRIASPNTEVDLQIVPQDSALADNQKEGFRCGDNGIFKGVPVTKEQRELTEFAKALYEHYPTDGKYIADGDELIVCHSGASTSSITTDHASWTRWKNYFVNPLGDWTGGPDVDAGATNRKLGSDMGDSITGGGLFGKDLSKADVSCNIFAFVMAQIQGCKIEMCCGIGDNNACMYSGGMKREYIPFTDIVDFARAYIKIIGGFEKFAEWGLIR